ncbi:hypothetical protein AMS68_006599 [Peltaster fructicola]|uniref:Rab proteins geranylgeranyltransferase n=1 Tax=Peltaster fructicola TaxID=286661 RepID=A0A6H0Y239_9PEZI|nr:hypothetical protein AMS68_006599 [Peltaster fructicola]
MDTLFDTEWDVLISGTGLKQSLLALALSRSGKKVLHVDQNIYYGGDEAELSLSEADTWVQQYSGNGDTAFSHARITKNNDSTKELGSARSYCLALAPQLIFTRSNLLPALVSSKTHGQLEFQAVGSWFVLHDGELVKVPNGREDIFQDTSLDLRAKRALMKFIRSISEPEALENLSADAKASSVPTYLENNFGLPAAARVPIMALTLSSDPPANTTVETALPHVIRHLQSIGLFGPGFGALTPKWGGLAEVAQVACRAGAVGGGVYILGCGVKAVDTSSDLTTVTLSNDEKVKTTWLVGSPGDLNIAQTPDKIWSRAVHIVAAPLDNLFPRTAEGGVTPAGAVITVSGKTPQEPPVYIFVHSSDTGECPTGYCVLYASVALGYETGFNVLQEALQHVLSSLGVDASEVLWSMEFQHSGYVPESNPLAERILAVSSLGPELALEDNVLDSVRTMWQTITQEESDTFMRFEAREGAEDEDINEQ